MWLSCCLFSWGLLKLTGWQKLTWTCMMWSIETLCRPHTMVCSSCWHLSRKYTTTYSSVYINIYLHVMIFCLLRSNKFCWLTSHWTFIQPSWLVNTLDAVLYYRDYGNDSSSTWGRSLSATHPQYVRRIFP